MSFKNKIVPLGLVCAFAIAPTAQADESAPLDRLPDALEELDRRADEFGDQARETVEEFLTLVGPMLEQLSLFIKDLPAYHAPEILPNGDIIIRRKNDRAIDPDKTPDGEIET